MFLFSLNMYPEVEFLDSMVVLFLNFCGSSILFSIVEMKSESEVAQSCPTFRDPMDCSLPGSSVRGILQARVLEWVTIAFSMLLEYFLLKHLYNVVLISAVQQSDSVIYSFQFSSVQSLSRVQLFATP